MSGIGTGGTPLILASPAPSTGGGGGGVTSINGLIGAVTFTPGANITFTPSGNGFIISATGGGGTPGSPDLSIQGNDGGAFAGILGSVIDFTNGLITLTPPNSGTVAQAALTINGDAFGNDALDIIGPFVNNAGIYVVNTSNEDSSAILGQNNAGGDAVVGYCIDTNGFLTSQGLHGIMVETDSIGSGVSVMGLGVDASLDGTNVTGDNIYGGYFSVGDFSTGGVATEVSGIFAFATGNGTTALVTGMHVGYGGGGVLNIGIFVESQRGNAAIVTEPGDPSYFGPIFTGGTAGSQPTTAPSWTSGAGVPASTPLAGSMYSNTNGGLGSSFYYYDGSAWVPTSGLPGGSPMEIQFNNTGAFGGIPGSSVDGINGLIALTPTGTGVALTLTAAYGFQALKLFGASTVPAIDIQNSLQQSTVGAEGSASTLPGLPSGYLPIIIDGTEYVIPFYAAT